MADFSGGSVVDFPVAQDDPDEDAPLVAPDEDAVLGVELDVDVDDALGVEPAQKGRRGEDPSSSLRDFLRLLRFLHSSTRAL